MGLVYFDFFDTATCFAFPHQLSPGRTLVHKKSKRGVAVPYKKWV